MNIRLSTISLAVLLSLHQGVLWAEPLTLDPTEVSDSSSQKTSKKSKKTIDNSSLKKGASVTLSFVDAEIEAVARTISVVTGKNLVIDPRVKGQITLSTERPVAPAVAYQQFVSALRMQNFAVVESDGITKIVPESEAKIQGGTVVLPEQKISGNQIVTQIFNLQYSNPNSVLAVLRPLISPNNVINVGSNGTSLVITDYAENLKRMATIIAANDVPNATNIEIVPIKHAVANDIAVLVNKLTDVNTVAGAGGADSSYKTTIISDARTNSLILRGANQSRIKLVKDIIAKLDQPTSVNASGNVHVVYLKNADATKLAVTLRATLAAANNNQSAGGFQSGGTNQAISTGVPNGANSSVTPSGTPSTGGQIQADPATNSLVIYAPEAQMRQLRAVIDQLDGRRSQVYVESLIAEINSDKAAEMSLQLQGSVGKVGDNILALLGSNFGSDGNNILKLTAQGIPTFGAGTTTTTVVPGKGFNVGILPKINGNNVLGLFGRLLETTGEGNVLSTPNVVTLDNEEAKIIIGQNVPFVTGQYTSSTTGNSNPFQTIERKDVGLTLKVKPQISENGTIKLQIFQEVSSVQASSATASTGIITNKRSIESNVLVEDGSIIVLGGLIQEEFASNQDKVPGLGDIPFVGHLFKSESRQRKKTNLMVFLRPVVMRDAQASQNFSLDRYDLMRANQQDSQPAKNIILGNQAVPVLPSLVVKEIETKEPFNKVKKADQ
jgi:general secretion pathway protein D